MGVPIRDHEIIPTRLKPFFVGKDQPARSDGWIYLQMTC